MSIARIAAVACIALATAGCAGFEFYQDAALKGTETGIPIYPAKPYLLVAHTGDPTKPVDVSVQYIPDFSKPVYAKARSGWGSSNLTMTFNNGIMTQFGQQVDANTAGIVSSLGTLATSVGGLKSTQGVKGRDGQTLEFSLYEIDNSGGTTVLRPVAVPQ
jgi:hypothetical protein